MDSHSQHSFDVRFGWGAGAVSSLSPADVFVIVDVLSFSTAVDVAVGAGGAVYPYQFGDDGAATFAAEVGAHLAVHREHTDEDHPYSLSPGGMAALRPGDRVVLPSPNGARLSLAAVERAPRVIAGCLRNAAAVASESARHGTVNVVAAGERWPDGTMRPAFEDLVGAGAVVAALPERLSRSPEAVAAAGAFTAVGHDLVTALLACASGRELVDRGWTEDVYVAARHDESRQVPTLRDGAYRA